MKLHPFKIILWLLFAIIVLLNSIRLFIYGFVISFIIVIIDRAFFGTRKRSDRQFQNLFVGLTLFFAICYTFSPFFRFIEFEISHPKWEHLQIVDISKNQSKTVYSYNKMIEKTYTTMQIHYIDTDGASQNIRRELMHYALVPIPFLFQEDIIEKELDFIHQRGVNKLIDKKSIHLYKHPHKNRYKEFTGNDAFAVRHSVGFIITMIITYILSIGLSIYVAFNYKKVIQLLRRFPKIENKLLLMIIVLLMVCYIIVGITIIHYLKFI